MEESEYLEQGQLARHAAQCVGRMLLYQDSKPSTQKATHTSRNAEIVIDAWKKWKGSILPHRKRVRADRKKGRRM
jgi:hypothetical protein